MIHSQSNPTIFAIAVIRVVFRERISIREDLDCFFKSDLVFSSVTPGFDRVPLELILELLIHARIVSREQAKADRDLTAWASAAARSLRCRLHARVRPPLRAYLRDPRARPAGTILKFAQRTSRLFHNRTVAIDG